MSKTKPHELTEEQEKLKAQYTPKMPDGLSDTAKELFKKAVSKITVMPHGLGLKISYEKLSMEELFALGLTGFEEWPFYPPSVKEKLDDMRPSFPTSDLDVAKQLFDANKDNQKRLLEKLRKEVLLTQHGEKFPPRRAKGAISKKTAYIHKLATDYPDKFAKVLFGEADKSIIGNMKEGTFANHVSEARNPKS
jgi:hypothetical protein